MAYQKYTKAIELNPNISIYYSNRARTLKLLNKLRDSMNDCRKAYKLD